VDNFEQRADGLEHQVNFAEWRMDDKPKRLEYISTNVPSLLHVTPCLGLWPSGALGGEKARLRVGFKLRIVAVWLHGLTTAGLSVESCFERDYRLLAAVRLYIACTDAGRERR
jgi:hypothetical protein